VTKRPTLVLGLAALTFLSGAGFAADRWAAARAARGAREEAEGCLEKATALARKYPRVFGPLPSPSARGSSIKVLAQEFAASRNVTLGYLSESEREGEKGRRERQVILRLMDAPHPNLVRFLEDLEGRSGGAKVKEIHIRPSREIPDAYQEAEIVLSKGVTAAPEKKP
jgi:hypothetical protein